jgi:hypothetical protein
MHSFQIQPKYFKNLKLITIRTPPQIITFNCRVAQGAEHYPVAEFYSIFICTHQVSQEKKEKTTWGILKNGKHLNWH